MHIFNGIFIAIFMTMLTLPLLLVDLASDRVSVQENRMLARRPVLADMKNQPEKFIRDFDDWFKDSTGFRNRLVAMYNVMGNNIWYNGIWYTDGQYIFLIGEEGHIYLGNNTLISKFQGKSFLTDNQLANMATKLDEIKTYLDKQNIPLIVMFCTDKESVYPEFYPKSIKQGPEPIQLEVITGYLQEHTAVDVFNIRSALLAEKDNLLLYGMTGDQTIITHYNEIGGFFAYRELMRHINIYFPEIISYELNDVDIRYDKAGTPNVSLKQEKVYRRLDASLFGGFDHNQNEMVFNAAFENLDNSLPTILFLRDSFAGEEFIGKYIAQHFGKVVMIHFMNMEYIEEYIDRFNPDIVVFESVELQLDAFADAVARIPELP
jgi:hypothetical protein